MKRSLMEAMRRSPDCASACVLLALWVALPALSFAQLPPASEPPPLPPPAVIAPPIVTPIPTPPREAEPSSEPLPAIPRERTELALVLPLGSPTYARAAEAVHAGFLAAAEGAKQRFTVIAHGDGGLRAAFDEAKELGARVIVGPLLRDDLKTIATANDLPWTIALNQLDDSTPLSNRIYTLALSVESEGRQLARYIQKTGAHNIGVVTSDAPLQKRFASAFVGEWILQGGSMPVTFRLGHSPDSLTLLRREIGRAKLEAMLIAADADEAALAKPYIGQLPSYASSQVNDRQGRESRRELEAIYFIEIPWLADPNAPALAGIPRREFGSTALDRLYALGIDAFHVAQAFATGPPVTLEFDGATGHLTLDSARQFTREGVLMQFRDGEIVTAPPR